MKPVFKNAAAENLCWISLLSLAGSLQVLVVVVLIFSSIPMTLDPITEGVAPQLLRLFQPEREVSFYRFWIMLALAAQVVLIRFFSKHRLRSLAIAETAWLSLQIFASFKIIQYESPSWARMLLYAVLALSLCSKIFWPELVGIWRRRDAWFKHVHPQIVSTGVLVLVAVLGLWIFGPVQYFDKHIIALSILYYAAVFVFLRNWLASPVMAAGAVLVMIKLQLFNLGVAPMVWLYPDHTPLAHWPDIIIFTLALSYVRSSLGLRLWALACVIGFVMAARGDVLHPEFFKDIPPLSIFYCLHERHFFSYAASFIIPFIYMAVIVWTMIKGLYDRWGHDDGILAALAFYGLVCYARFIWHSDLYGFYWSPLPLVGIMSFVFARWVRRLKEEQAVIVQGVFLFLSLGALLTNVLFTFYPHALSFTGRP